MTESDRINTQITAVPAVSSANGAPVVILGFKAANMQAQVGLMADELSNTAIENIAQMLRETRERSLEMWRDSSHNERYGKQAQMADWERELLGELPHGAAETVPVNGVQVIRNMADGSPRCWGLSESKAQCGFAHGHMGVCSFDRD